MPSVVTGDRQQFQYIHIVFNINLEFNWCEDIFLKAFYKVAKWRDNAPLNKIVTRFGKTEATARICIETGISAYYPQRTGGI